MEFFVQNSYLHADWIFGYTSISSKLEYTSHFNVAPKATASSGFTPLDGSVPSKYSEINDCTCGIHV